MRTKRIVLRLALVFVILYATTWLVASRTLARQLREQYLNQWAAFAVQADPTTTYQLARLRAPQEAEAVKLANDVQ